MQCRTPHLDRSPLDFEMAADMSETAMDTDQASVSELNEFIDDSQLTPSIKVCFHHHACTLTLTLLLHVYYSGIVLKFGY